MIPRDEQLLLCAFVDWMGKRDIGLGRVLRHSNGTYVTDKKSAPRLRPLTAQECADLAAEFMDECNKLAPISDPLTDLNAGHAIAGLPTDFAQVAPVSAMEAVGPVLVQRSDLDEISERLLARIAREIEANATNE